MPPEGWTPDPAWGPAPEGWQFWQEQAPSARNHRKPDEKIGFFNGRKRAHELDREVTRLRNELDRSGAMSVAELRVEEEQLRASIEASRTSYEVERELELAALERRRAEAAARLAELQSEVVITEETALLQEAGIYQYRHPLTDAIAYQSELKRIQDQIKAMTLRDGGAVTGSTNWQVNNSLPKGRAKIGRAHV